jgi:hypothetical protein
VTSHRRCVRGQRIDTVAVAYVHGLDAVGASKDGECHDGHTAAALPQRGPACSTEDNPPKPDAHAAARGRPQPAEPANAKPKRGEAPADTRVGQRQPPGHGPSSALAMLVRVVIAPT